MLPELWKERAEIVRKYKEWLPKIANAAREVLGDVDVYLFGSVAEGKAAVSSDIDIMIVTHREDIARGRKRAEVIAEIEERVGLPFVHPFEFHLMTEKEFRKWMRIFRPKLVRVS